MNQRPRLLVSVRSLAEAEAAVLGGADVIDVKEPARGPLGLADASTILEIALQVGRRRPVSAALGEIRNWQHRFVIPPGLKWVKLGLSFCNVATWRQSLLGFQNRLISADGPRLVAVAYVDWKEAEAPEPQRVIDFACQHRCSALLLDTFVKDGRSLLDHLSIIELATLIEPAQDQKIPVALAGSLGQAEIRHILPLRPDYFAVRGSVCEGGRTGTICSGRVRRMAQLISGGAPCVTQW